MRCVTFWGTAAAGPAPHLHTLASCAASGPASLCGMPFTLAHPAAVLPLRRWPRLDFVALVIGSMTPDFGYYLLLPDMRLETHSFAGSLETCLPVGLLLVLLFHI